MTDSSIKYTKHGATVLAGPDAIAMYRAFALASAIGLQAKGICPTRGFTMRKGLAMATEITGKKYKRTEAAQAVADLKAWGQEMKAALPQIVEGESE